MARKKSSASKKLASMFDVFEDNTSKSSSKKKTKSSSSKSQSSTQKQVLKEIKKIKKFSPVTVLLVFVFLIIGLANGLGIYYLSCKNDTFEVCGEKNVTLEIGADYTYEELGAKVVEFGRNLSKKVEIKTNIPFDDKNTKVGEKIKLDTSAENYGTEYYVIYTIDSVKYGEVQRVRTILIGGEAE